MKEIDTLCVPFINFFNNIGLKTVGSCEGHNNANLHKFYIDFSKEVSDDDIHYFMKKFPAPFYGVHNNMQIKGHFIKICYGFSNNGSLIENWRYVVDLTGNYKQNQTIAYQDLKIFSNYL